MNTAELAPGIESKTVYLKEQNFNLHYLEASKTIDAENQSREDEIILLVHGWPTSSYLYRHMMLPLTQFHRVVALDLPGFGQSDKDPNARFSFPYHAEIIQGFLQQLGVTKVNLVVHDLGGPIGLWWAKQHTEMVESYVVLDTVIYPDLSWAVKLFVLMTLVPGIRNWIASASGIGFAMRLGVSNKSRMPQAVLEHYQKPFFSKVAKQTLLLSASRLNAKGFQDVAELMESTDKPICMIYGENDVILPEVGERFNRLHQAQPTSELRCIPNCGHFLQEDDPESVLKYMEGFYAKLADDRG